MNNVTVLNHPLIQHKLSILRDKNTGVKEFREIIGEISMLMCYEATRNLQTKKVEVETPVCMAHTRVLSGKKLVIVPILRAGLGMVDGIMNLIPTVNVGHIGLCRDPVTLKPVEYYCKMPNDMEVRDVIVLDPMLATGGSASKAIELTKQAGAKNIKFICIIATPQGISYLSDAHPDVEIYCAACDEKLNEHGHIVPGLGDAGDRMFGTR